MSWLLLGLGVCLIALAPLAWKFDWERTSAVLCFAGSLCGYGAAFMGATA